MIDGIFLKDKLGECVCVCVCVCVGMIARADIGFRDQLRGYWLIGDLELDLMLFVEMDGKQ